MKLLMQILAAALLLFSLPAFADSPLSVDRPGDKEITRWVNDALAADPRLAASDVAVSTADGIVTLVGSVHNLAGYHFAGLEAKKIKGVRGVINRIEVKAVQLPDADIRQQIRRRIINSSVMISNHLGVAVKNGEVTLTGTVDSFVEKQEAGVLASEVRGVAAVNNQIDIDYRAKRPDEEIRKDVTSRLNLDVYLVGAPITVTVTNGVVTLDGLVASPYQIDRAFTDTYAVRNVVDVRNKLQVQWALNSGTRDMDATPSDSDLARAIQDQLSLDLRIEHPWAINVEAEDGHVTLQGTLATYHQRRLAEQDTRNVVGVAWISNLIRVQPVLRSDQAMNEDARFNLDSDAALRGDIIKAFVNNGTLLLTGTVQSYFQKAQAENDVSRIVGIVDVVDDLDVNPQPRPDDIALKENVLQRLSTNWAIWPQLGDIQVTVQDGRVVLAGTVRTWQQRREAGRMAHLTKGVLAVDNRLAVKGAEYSWDKWYGANANGFVYDPYYNEDLYLNPAKGNWD